MQNELTNFQKLANTPVFNRQTQGHYESFFLRANHPSRPLAFWIRYTLFCPKNKPEEAMGELWVTFFDGETNVHKVAKQHYLLPDCRFSINDAYIQIGEAKLHPGAANGSVASNGNKLNWDLTVEGDSSPLLLLPPQFYKGNFPSAKSLVSLPQALFTGHLLINGERQNVNAWVGSVNHNWGTKHTDLYAWGQVAGFDQHPNSFLEVATAKLKLGPVWTPALTLLVLRHEQKEYSLNELMQSVRAYGKFNYFSWEFKSKSKDCEIEGKIFATANAFVGLKYGNPPGGHKYCLNSKIAHCKLQLKNKDGKIQILETKHRAAFEILTTDPNHGVVISA